MTNHKIVVGDWYEGSLGQGSNHGAGSLYVKYSFHLNIKKG